MKPSRPIDQSLRESELRLKIALRAAEIGIWDWNVATGEVELSARARSIFGFAPGAEVEFSMIRDVTHPDDLPRTRGLSQRALDPELREKPSYEYRILRADTGELRWVLAHGEAIFQKTDGGSRAVRYLGTIQDITQRKHTETALAESEMSQRLAIEAAGMALWQVNLQTQEVHSSPAFNELMGFDDDARPTLEEVRRCYLPGENERVRAAGQEAVERGDAQFEVEFRVRRRGGGARWLMVRAEILFDEQNTPERVLGVLMDIDDRKRNTERQTLLARELNHRVKNSLTVVQSLATQTFRPGGDVRDQLKTFQGRLQALAKANNVLLENDWEVFGIRPLVEEITGPYRDVDNDPVSIVGDDFTLPPVANVPLALALHELCTNAAKYGALSRRGGHVEITWSRVPEGMELVWTESGGPPTIEPAQYGFGTLLLTRVLAQQLGSVELHFLPEGLRCRMMMPLADQ